MNRPLAPGARYRLYTYGRSYGWFFRDLVLGNIQKGDDITRLENALEQKFDAKNVICTPMARVAIYHALQNLIQPGQDVILSPYTIADVVNMVICAGGRPVFADIDRDSCNISAEEVDRLIKEDTGAVLVTHLHGLAAPVFEIKEICDRHNVPLIEDAAQAFGAIENGRRLGTIGNAGIFSFGTYKNINSWYGGALVTNDCELAEKVRSELAQTEYQSNGFLLKKIVKSLVTDVATHPLLFKPLTFWVFRYGFLNDVEAINKKVTIELDVSRNDQIPEHYLARMTPFQARLVLSQLSHIDSDIEKRIKKAEMYRQGLKDIPGIVLPLKREGTGHMYTYYPIQCPERIKLLKYMMRNNRDIAAQHLHNCADLDSFKEFYRDCPSARKTAREVVLLPTYPRYSDKDVRANIDVIRAYFKQT